MSGIKIKLEGEAGVGNELDERRRRIKATIAFSGVYLKQLMHLMNDGADSLPEDPVILILNTADEYGGGMQKDLKGPQIKWNLFRDGKSVPPFVGGFANRKAVMGKIAVFDEVASNELLYITSRRTVVVVDHGLAEVISA